MENKEITYDEFGQRYGREALDMLKSFIPEWQKIVLSLPYDQQNLWVAERIQLQKLNKRKYKLEEALDNDQIPVEELTEANSNIMELEKQIANLEDYSYQLIAAHQRRPVEGRHKFPDRGARDGGVSIRPGFKNDTTPSATRLKKI